MQKLLTFFQQNISIYAIFGDQSFNDALTNNIVNFEQLGPGSLCFYVLKTHFHTIRLKHLKSNNQFAL